MRIALLLAAGKGTRMRSPLPKVLVPVHGRPILQHLVDHLHEAGVDDVAVVVGHGADQVRAGMGPGFVYVTQSEQLGMAHAVRMARPVLGSLPVPPDEVLVFVGDSPLLRPSTIRRLLERHTVSGAACTFLTAVFPQQPPYARVFRDAEGRVVGCREERSCTEAQKKVRELLTSHYVFRADALWSHLDAIPAHPQTGEYYLTDIIEILLAEGLRVEAVPVDDWEETVGLNTPEEVRWAEGWGG